MKTNRNITFNYFIRSHCTFTLFFKSFIQLQTKKLLSDTAFTSPVFYFPGTMGSGSPRIVKMLKHSATWPLPVPLQQHRQHEPVQPQDEPLKQTAEQPGLRLGTPGGHILNFPGPSCSVSKDTNMSQLSYYIYIYGINIEENTSWILK